MKEQESIFFLSELKMIIENICKEFDDQWRKRKRSIGTYFLVLLIFKLVMSKNKQGYNSVLCELWNTASGDEQLKLPRKAPMAASSVCEARQKLPETIFQNINEEILLYWRQTKPRWTWNGHRVFAVDGSKINLPRELKAFGYKIQDEKVQHYPTGLMSVLYNLGDGMAYDFILQSNLDERLCAINHMNKMEKGDILVLDRGYFSYFLLHQSIEKGVHILCRMQHGTINAEIENFWNSKKIDETIEYVPSRAVINDLKKRGFNLEIKAIPLRLIKYKIGDEIYVCATTLIDKDYPVEEFSRLYHGRWGIEELYKISKQFIDVEDFHAKTERGVKQEIYAHLLLINIARIFEFEAKSSLPPTAVHEESVELEDSYWQGFRKDLQKMKINFKNCLLVINRNLERLLLSSKESIADLLQGILVSIARVRQKIRPGRHYPRTSFKPAKKWMRGLSCA